MARALPTLPPVTLYVCRCGYVESHPRPDRRCRNWGPGGAHKDCGPFDAPFLVPVRYLADVRTDTDPEGDRLLITGVLEQLLHRSVGDDVGAVIQAIRELGTLVDSFRQSYVECGRELDDLRTTVRRAKAVLDG